MSEALRLALLAAVVGFVSTVAVMPLVIRAMRRRAIIDTPNERSSHAIPTPRGGGLACLAGIACAAIAVIPMGENIPPVALVAGLALAAVGFADDVRSLHAAPRLLIQVVVGAASGLFIAGFVGAAVGAAAVVVCVNTVNFMDGINGITGVTVAIWGVSIAAGAWEISASLVALGAAVASTAVAFLFFNFPGASVFLGDAGSYMFGGFIAIGSIIAIEAGVSIAVVLAPLVIYLSDVFATLTRRAWRGERLHLAHREHAYQQLTDVLGHVGVTTAIGAVMAATVLTAFFAPWPWTFALCVAVALAVVATPLILQRPRRRAPTQAA